MPRDMNKPAEYTAEQDKLLLSQYHAVGPAAINAALQCKSEKPAPAPRQHPYDTQTD
ncbi:transcriptional regulator [Nitratireductor aquimarinus]|uniref:Transcriptional regulator n=2 Tax=Pseudomonadota TaxID=1224 RepID=A0ABU4AJM3_9HYPH|nr:MULTISPECIES: transcriptional regulator [Nitratireductor]MCV0379104.1 transcriptional regulator [Nitratireductor sp.]MBN7763913.1 transcriptional regulator [Nitratireductor aquibiodomus]MBN7778657.1 transcriptional regulator [Nitratireductor pacificus]MBN7782980.1 transcriptional regulator [Nitratireductor pacificus]MBN7791786.1 transcriptional regulator [Nitratireductor aquimarinus]